MALSPKIVLASSSLYRKALLKRLQLQFDCISPEVDESPIPGETAENLVLRLARSKAEAVATDLREALVIGSDQVAVLGTVVLNKPGSRENARKQLKLMGNHTVRFITGLCVINTATNEYQTEIDTVYVSFRDYSDEEIERYLDIDRPYDCAGSFKSEQMGITLISKMQGEDPTGLIGLPLIKLAGMLRKYQILLP